MSGFSIPLDKLAAAAGARLEDVARKVTFDLFAEVVRRSPVGNPELWIANESRGVGKSSRDAYAQDAAAYNEANPGKRRAGTSRAAIDKLFPLAAGKGYVGGRFRANWNVSFGQADETTVDVTDQARSQGELQKVFTLPIGGVMYLTNSLPYAKRLEDGWSTQAPTGMVKLSVQNFNDHINKALQK